MNIIYSTASKKEENIHEIQDYKYKIEIFSTNTTLKYKIKIWVVKISLLCIIRHPALEFINKSIAIVLGSDFSWQFVPRVDGKE